LPTHGLQRDVDVKAALAIQQLDGLGKSWSDGQAGAFAIAQGIDIF
jgi:hypothetical protein